MIYHIWIRYPACENIKLGKKHIEGRLYKPFFRKLKKGDILIINKSFMKIIKYICIYNTFYEMLTTETLNRVLPDINNIEKGIAHYNKIYKDDISKYKVISICLN